MKVYRSEWKYTLTNQELSLLKSRLCEVKVGKWEMSRKSGSGGES